MMNKSNLKGGVILILIIACVGFILYTRWLKTLSQTYTIGEITDIYTPADGGPVANYSYEINDELYENFTSIEKEMYSLASKGKCYIISIPIEHDSYGIVLFNYPVPKDFPPPPLNGWSLEELQKLYPSFRVSK